MKVIIAGGGTGGHLFPAVAVGEELVRERPATEVLFVGTSAGMESKWLPKSGLRHELLAVHGIRGHGPVERLRALVEFGGAVGRALSLLKSFGADLVVSAGGYASAPMAVAAIARRTPLLLMEQNTKPGLTNRVLARFADVVCVGFDETAGFFRRGRVVVAGNPVRFEIPPQQDRPRERSRQILVLGGSSGAHRLNLGVVNCFRNWREGETKPEIVHQTGDADLAMVRQAYESFGITAEVYPFIDDMATAFARADLVIARSGAMTVSEVALARRPAIFVPYPFHRDRQQELNANVLVRLGGAVVVRDDEKLGENLAATLQDLLGDPARLEKMAQAAGRAAKPGAAAKAAALCFEIGASKRGAA